MQKMPQARRSGLIIQEVDSEILIYDQETDKAHCLNPTAAKVWNYCDGETTNWQGSGQSISDLQNLPEDSIPDLRHRTLA